MELPPALAPWGPLLRIFPPDVALSLGPLLQRLAAAVGPLRSPLHSGDGEVDGFDGLARRGSYERLLVSEWLLAEEAPEEFLRRAATGEHTFLRLARPEPMGSRRSVVLFDAGPGQLGSPRIAQLAALIVLARRALAADALFGWGVLQRPEVPLRTEVTAANVMHLILSRTPWEAGEAHLGAWSEILKGWKDLDDLWIVGSPGLGLPAARRVSRLEIRDVLEPGVRRLTVTVRRGEGPRAEVALDLPPDPDCVRLLRDPFAAAVAPPSGISPAMRPDSNLVFSVKGNRLLMRARDGGLLVLPVPNSARAPRSRPEVRFPQVPANLIVAAGAERTRISAVLCGTAGLVAATGTGKGDDTEGDLYLTGEGGPLFEVRSNAPLRPIFRHHDRLFTLDAAGSLFRLSGPRPYRTWLLQERVLAARQSGEDILVAALDSQGVLFFARIPMTGTGVRRLPLIAHLQPTEAFFGFGNVQGDRTDSPGLVAVRNGNEWVIFHGPRTHLRIFSGTRAAGVVRETGQGNAVLLLIDEDGRSLSLVGKNFSKRLLTASAAIDQVAVSSEAPVFAYTTVNGEVTVASASHGTVFARWHLEGT
jgi:hypothetical protein